MLSAKLSTEADVDDCFSRVFEKLWTSGSQSHPVTRGAWLLAVARQEAALFWRKQQRAASIHQTIAEEQASYRTLREAESDTPYQRLLDADLASRLQQAIETLPNEQQQVLHLRLHQQQTFRQIAEQLRIPLGTALGRFHQAVAKLRSLLSAES